jgi:hypothetical protein
MSTDNQIIVDGNVLLKLLLYDVNFRETKL